MIGTTPAGGLGILAMSWRVQLFGGGVRDGGLSNTRYDLD